MPIPVSQFQEEPLITPLASDTHNAYANAYYLERMQEMVRQGKKAKMAFLDIDATLTGNIAAAKKVRNLLRQQDYVTVFVTTRPEEMCMSKKQYDASLPYGFDRPPALLDKTDPKNLQYKDPADDPEFYWIIDPDIIASQTGNRIFIGQNKDGHLDGYMLDSTYDEQLKQGSVDWRADTLAMLREFDARLVNSHLSPIDREGAYEKHKIDVALFQNRINLDFVADINKYLIDTPGATTAGIDSPLEQQELAYKEKEAFLKKFRIFQDTYGGKAYQQAFHELQTTYHETFRDAKEQLGEHEYVAFREKQILVYQKELEELQVQHGLDPKKVQALQNIQFIEDSNPDKGRYSLYIMPALGHKARAVNEIVQKTCEALSIQRNDLVLFFAGDSMPDVSMGLHGGLGTQATFLIVGGSRLTDAFVNPAVSQFAGESLTHLKQRFHKKAEGLYEFHEPLGLPAREVIIGHYAYPGTVGPESILTYLESKLN
jgi:hydroxymethylpyrimidine pyrophosphatase-like HAD family hydrolase